MWRWVWASQWASAPGRQNVLCRGGLVGIVLGHPHGYRAAAILWVAGEKPAAAYEPWDRGEVGGQVVHMTENLDGSGLMLASARGAPNARAD